MRSSCSCTSLASLSPATRCDCTRRWALLCSNMCRCINIQHCHTLAIATESRFPSRFRAGNSTETQSSFRFTLDCNCRRFCTWVHCTRGLCADLRTTLRLSFGRRHVRSRAFSHPRRHSSSSIGALGFRGFLDRSPAFHRRRLKVLALQQVPLHLGLRQRPAFSGSTVVSAGRRVRAQRLANKGGGGAGNLSHFPREDVGDLIEQCMHGYGMLFEILACFAYHQTPLLYLDSLADLLNNLLHWSIVQCSQHL